jgi:probable rRNA maturation factor
MEMQASIHLRFEEDIPPEQAKELRRLLRKAIRETLLMQGVAGNCEVSVLISTDERIQTLNNQFLGVDAPTDVLAFPADVVDPQSGRRYLGDVMISLPRAMAQAQSGGHPLQDEILLLAVHGVLHLLGFDHADEKTKKMMWDVQSAVLERVGCAKVNPDE